MNKPFTIAFSTTASTPAYFIENAAQSFLIRNIAVHNIHSGSQIIHLTYKVGYADTIGIGTAYDFYSQTLSAKATFIYNDLIVCNPGDSVGVYGDGSAFNVVANCVLL